MLKVECLTLTGDALKWAVFKSLGFRPAKLDKWKMGRLDESVIHAKNYVTPEGYTRRFSSVDFLDWSIGGPTCERLKIGSEYVTHADGRDFNPGIWLASVKTADGVTFKAIGSNELESKLRCLVISTFGTNEIEVPKELT
jgi:hypothetical protein